MSQPPFFTIVIPTYNREDLILETLESVFQQTYKNFEIIVVDNCSTDRTIEVLQPLVEQGKIQLIQNAQNLERSRARNVGIKAAKGDYLTLLDSDDFMYPSNLQDAADFIKANKHSNFFHNYYELVDANLKPLHQYRYPSEGKQLKRLAMGNFISCIGVFMSREVFTNYQFNEDEDILGSEDWELWIRVRSAYPLGVIAKVNNGIRHHSGRSISSYEIESVLIRKMYIINHLLKNEQVAKVFGEYEEDMRAAALVFAAIVANDAQLYRESRKYLSKALSKKPSLLLDSHFLRVSRNSILKLKKNLNTI